MGPGATFEIITPRPLIGFCARGLCRTPSAHGVRVRAASAAGFAAECDVDIGAEEEIPHPA